MNERYLFRGKQIYSRKWVEGNLEIRKAGAIFGKPETVCFIGRFIESMDVSSSPVDPETIGQCTGLRDKNGQLIFEGDILGAEGFWNFLVKWDEPRARFILSRHRGINDMNCESPDKCSTETRWEIIGNKWDNPELMEAL